MGGATLLLEFLGFLSKKSEQYGQTSKLYAHKCYGPVTRGRITSCFLVRVGDKIDKFVYLASRGV
jgi:hypothetical protein